MTNIKKQSCGGGLRLASIVGYFHSGQAGGAALKRYAAEARARVVATFTEKSADRRTLPALRRAIEASVKHSATIVAPSFAQTANNLAALTLLLESSVSIVALDVPALSEGADTVTLLRLMRQLAEARHDEISAKTRAGQSRAWAAGKQKGNPGAAKIAQKAHELKSARADEFALRVGGLIEQIDRDGDMTLTEIGRELERRRIATASGRLKWQASSVRAVRLRHKKVGRRKA